MKANLECNPLSRRAGEGATGQYLGEACDGPRTGAVTGGDALDFDLPQILDGLFNPLR